MSEFEALEALLLPSTDNVATLLAKWDAGSEAAFVAKMNAEARTLELQQTHYADASGARSATVSTAADQMRLAMVALRVPAFAEIVAMPQATLPIAGVQYNLDALLGRYGIVGVKTGSTAAAGGCFVFAAHERVAGRQVTVVGAVLGQLATPAYPSILQSAFRATITLLGSIPHALESFTIGRNATLAWVRAPWTRAVAARPADVVSLVGWPGLPVRVRIVPARRLRAPLHDGQSVGVAELTAGQQRTRVRLVASGAMPSASFGWRASHP